LVSNLRLTIRKEEISEVETTNFLGTDIWEKHIDEICNKMSSNLFVIKKLPSIADADVLHTAYYGLVYPLTYHKAVWGQSCKKYTRKVFILQERSVRCIAGLIPTDVCQESFVILQFPTVYSLYILEVILFAKNKDAAITNGHVQNHITRSNLDYH
jgi:hypothetical protein